MYAIEFFQKVLKAKNIGVLIYLIININLVVMLFSLMEFSPVVGIFIYFVSVFIALSPVGEFILRLKLGCNKIQRKEHVERLLPIFNEVYSKAKEKDPSLPEDIKLYINSSQGINAFATGRKTICVTKGLLSISDEEIKATLAHEFGHLSNKDTDLILLITIGNFMVTLLFVFFRIFFWFIALVAGFVSESLVGLISGILVDGLLVLAMWAWTKFGILLVMHASRLNEFEADKFAAEMGYTHSLITLLDKIGDGAEGETGLFANLASSHPSSDIRIATLQENDGQITEQFTY